MLKRLYYRTLDKNFSTQGQVRLQKTTKLNILNPLFSTSNELTKQRGKTLLILFFSPCCIDDVLDDKVNVRRQRRRKAREKQTKSEKSLALQVAGTHAAVLDCFCCLSFFSAE